MEAKSGLVLGAETAGGGRVCGDAAGIRRPLVIAAAAVKTVKMPAGNLKTTPLDPRFPNQNQAQHCWTRYNEYVLCLKNNDGDEDSCKKYFQFAASICPSAWTERWETEREEGTFAGVQFPKN